MKPFLVALAIALSQLGLRADEFTVDGSVLGDRKVIVSYDPKTPHLYDVGADVSLVQGTETIAKLTGLGIDWSWSGDHPERAIHRVEWSTYGDLFRIHYQAGRILTGFTVYRLNGDKTVTEVPVYETVGALYKDGKTGKPPQSSNNSGIHALTWLSRSTLLCDIHTADKGISYVTVKIGRDNVPKITNIFQLDDEDE